MSSASMNKLAMDIQNIKNGIPIAANERKKDAVLAIENGLTQTTPIDTGSSISNWIVNIGVPRLEIIQPYAPSALGQHNHHLHGEMSGAPLNAQGAMDLARAVVARVQPGEPVFITQSDPAVYATDTGLTPMREENLAVTSPGYVDRAIMVGVRSISRAKLDV